MPYFYPNTYYNPFINQGIFGGPIANFGPYETPGIFGVYRSYADFVRDLNGPPRTPVVPNPFTNTGESLDSIDARMARGGPSYNSATGKFENPSDKGIKDKTGEETKGYGALPWVGAGLYGLNTLGNLFLGWRSLDLAREQFNFQRDLANQNLAASIQAYNEAQRARLRGMGYTEEEVDRIMKEQGRELKDTRKNK